MGSEHNGSGLNDPRGALGIGVITALIHHDREAFYEITSELEGGCPEALGGVAEAIVRSQLRPGSRGSATWKKYAR
jgi:hypothetical protein